MDILDAVTRNDLHTLKVLLDTTSITQSATNSSPQSSPNVNFATVEHGKTALHIVATTGAKDALKLLLVQVLLYSDI